MKLSEYKRVFARHVCVFGPPKAGKTALVGQLARKYRLWYLDLEKGIVTLLHTLPKEFHGNVEVFNIPDNKSFPVASATVLQVLKGGKCNICWEHGVVGCSLCIKAGKAAEFSSICCNEFTENDILVIDSGTQYTTSVLNHITRKENEEYKLKTDDWGELSRVMFAAYSYIQTAKFHIIVVTHEVIEKMEDGKMEKIVPAAGSGNFARSVAKFFDEVVYVEIKNSQHKAGSSTLYSNNIMTGSRSGVVMEKSSSPTLFDIFDPEFAKTLQGSDDKAKQLIASIGVKKA